MQVLRILVQASLPPSLVIYVRPAIPYKLQATAAHATTARTGRVLYLGQWIAWCPHEHAAPFLFPRLLSIPCIPLIPLALSLSFFPVFLYFFPLLPPPPPFSSRLSLLGAPPRRLSPSPTMCSNYYFQVSMCTTGLSGRAGSLPLCRTERGGGPTNNVLQRLHLFVPLPFPPSFSATASRAEPHNSGTIHPFKPKLHENHFRLQEL